MQSFQHRLRDRLAFGPLFRFQSPTLLRLFDFITSHGLSSTLNHFVHLRACYSATRITWHRTGGYVQYRPPVQLD